MSSPVVAPMRSLKDRVAELKNEINSQYPGNAVVDLKLHELDAAIFALENPGAPPQSGLAHSGGPAKTPVAAGFPKTLADTTPAKRSNMVVDNPGEEAAARKAGFTRQV